MLKYQNKIGGELFMYKKIALLIMISILVLSITTGSTGQNAIVDSMDFQGEVEMLSLDDAIDRALTDNPTIEKNKLNLENAQLEFEKKSNDIKEAKERIKKDTWQYKESVDLPKLETEYNLSNAQRNYDKSIADVKKEVEQAYFNLLHAQTQMDINKENVEIAESLYEHSKMKFELGDVTEKELSNSELNYLQAQKDYKVSEDNIKSTKMALNIKLGREVMENLNLQDKLIVKEVPKIGIAEAVTKALDNRSEVKTVEYNYQKADIEMKSISIQYPDITYQYKEKKIALEEAKRNLEKTKKDIEMEIRDNYMTILQKSEEIKINEKSVALSKKVLDITQASYNLGASVNIDVEQAQADYQTKRIELSNAILDYNVALMNYENSMGN